MASLSFNIYTFGGNYMYKSTLMEKFSIASATAVLMTAGSTGSAIAASLYSISDLGHLGGFNTIVNDINNRGQVVGRSNINIFNDHRGFLWENGTMTALPQPIKLQGIDVGIGEALAINDLGNILGWATGANKSLQTNMIWQGTSSPTALTGFNTRVATPSYNNLGQVVINHNSGQNYVWQNGSITNLFMASGTNSWVSGINDVGQVIGSSSNGGFLCEGGVTPINVPPGYTPQPFTPGFICQQGITYLGFNPYKINNQGQIIGGEFLWENGSITNLGFVGKDINETGQILGSMSLWDSGDLFDLNDLLLNSPGWEILEAKAINDLGQIVGQGRFNGQERAFIMNPIAGTQARPKSVPTSVPEPSFGLGLLGLGALAAAMPKRKEPKI
jgi:probable HAF family extracellular repeat protein